MSLSRIFARLPRLLVMRTIGLLIAAVALGLWQPLAAQDANTLLQHALAAVRNADGFTVDMRYTQRQTGLVARRDNVLELAIRGEVQGTGKARFTFSAPFVQSWNGGGEQEYLLADGLVYQRAGEQWQRVEDLPASEQMAGGGLSLAAAASNVIPLSAQETELGRYERIAFALEAEDVLRFLLAQGGSLTPESLTVARLGAPRMEGTGELWVDPAGLPARLILDLRVQKAGEQTPTLVHTVATYSGFGAAFPPGTFDPTASPTTSLPLAEKKLERIAPPVALILAGVLGLGFLALLFLRRRWATQVVTAVVLAGLLTPPLHGTVQAVRPQRDPTAVAESSTPPGAELTQLLDETRALSNQLQIGLNPAFQLAENSDYDFDGIPNGVELQLGTNPFVADTDQDGLTDFQEIAGFPCGGNKWVETDPLNPDSNGDGVNDGAEFYRGQCNSSDSTVPNAWNDDNDGDGVPDWLDLSPFTASGILAGENKVGPSFTFETLDQNPGGETNPYPYYVDLQIRPFGGASLQYAYKKLYWPFDMEGPIQVLLPGAGLKSSGEIQLVPFLEVQVQCQDLPRKSTMQEYGIQASALGNAQCPHAHAPYAMQIPLLPVEEGGIVHAFQARVLHDDFTSKLGNQTLLMQRWKDVRLKWVVQADVSLLNDEGVPAVSDSGYYGLMVYEEAFQITGLQVTRQGGVSMLAAANIPNPSVLHDTDSTDAPIALLRAGLEAQFLGGNLNLGLFKNIFDDPSSVSSEQRWGITEKFRVRYDGSMDYEHMDEALDDLTTRVTPELLSEVYSGGPGNLEPTLVLASEQRTSVVNLDELDISNFNQIVVNTCLNPLVTSRSLKLQKYQQGVGGPFAQWYPLNLDQVLQRLDKKMPNYAVPFAGRTVSGHNLLEDAAAHNIHKLATTAWFMGQTAIRAVGDKEFQKVTMDAAAVAAALLDESGLLPDSYTDAIDALLDVFEAGGPAAWLQQQWNRTVGIVQGVEDFVGSFLDWTPSLTMPGEATFLSWTHTAINALNFLALVTGEKIFGQVASFLTTIIEVYRTVRVIIDTITAAVDAAANGVSAVLDVIAQEIASLARPLGLVGTIFNIAVTWISLAAIIGDLPPGLAAVAISKAIVDTVIYVVIFAIAAAIPLVGAIIAVVFTLIKILSDLVGEPLTPFDLTATFLADLFAPKLEGHVYMVGQNWTNVDFKALQPLGGFVEKRAFAIEVESVVTLQGRTDLMDDSYVYVVLGQQLYTKWKSAGSLSTGTPGKQWPFGAEQIGWATGPLVPVDMPLEYKVSQQDNVSSARMTINPWYPLRNASISVSMVLDAQLAQLWDDTVHVQKFYCGDGCWEQGTTPKPPLGSWETPGPIVIGPMKYDVLPATLYGFWNWDELVNFDIDGDGLWGYKQPGTGNLVGPDVNLCPSQTGIPSVYNVDSDGDGLSDAFELATPGLDPCKKDSDGDGLDDRKELLLGTNPAVADTDGDGLSDGEEVARWISGELLTPWRVELRNAAGVFTKNPAVFPNPRQANLDGDHRNDGEEWAKKSSPNARNVKDGDEYPFPISVSTLGPAAPNQALIVMQALAETTEIGLAPTLVITLPTTSVGATVQLDLLPTLGNADLDTVTPLPGGIPNVLVYQLPPLLPGRGLVAHVNGPTGAPDGLAGLQVDLTYEQGGRRHQQQRTLQPVGRSRLLTAITEPLEGARLAGAVTIQGTTRGYPGATAVYVCVTTATACAENQYAPAEGVERWSYPFTPAANGTHRIFAYAANDLGGRGPVAGPVTVQVDRTPPAGLAIDLNNGMAISSTAVVDGLPALSLPLRASDSGGSGLAHIAVSDGQGRAETLDVPAARQGDASFQLLWPLPGVSRGDTASVLSTQFISLTLTAVDGAGNSASTAAPVRLLVDDTPPALEATLPAVIDGGLLRVSGHADDRRHEPGARQPYSTTRSASDAATRLTLGGVSDFATIVGDMNGDGLDEVVWVQPATAASPLQAALFFGHPALPATLALAEADVRFTGQAAGASAYPPVVANAGDVNGDGLDDLLIGDPGARRGAGSVYLLLGRPASDWFSPFALANADRAFAPAGTTAFGVSLASAGDTDGDGLDDYLLAAANTGTGSGGVWLALGQEESAPPLLGPWEMALVPACIGCATVHPPTLAGPGDVDGDGVDDMLVGYPQTVALILGRERLLWPVGTQPIIAVAGTRFALAGDFVNVAALGDANGDGLLDMLMADPDSSPARVFVVVGRRHAWPLTGGRVDLLAQAERIYQESTLADSRLGASLAPLGDVDGDRLADFAMGQPGRGAGPNRVLLALSTLARGERVLEASQSTQIVVGPGAAANLFGRSLSSGQVNGDGVADLLTLAPRAASAHLFQPERSVTLAAGLNRVEIGAVGPLVDSTVAPASVSPTSWVTAPWETGSGACAVCWRGSLNLSAPGVYYIYARALDQAGNWSPGETWFQGAVTVMGQAGRSLESVDGTFNLSLGQPVVAGRSISTTVAIGGLNQIRDWRYFDGRRWHDLPLIATRQTISAPLPLLDGQPLTLRLAARTIYGITDQISLTLPVDNQPPLLLPTANLPARAWQTDLSPTLVVTWPEVTDRSGVAGVWAVIDTRPDTVPTTPVVNNRVQRTLDTPAAYYAHILAVDNAGNRALRHLGPFGANRSRTPSVAAVDGILDLAGGEYPQSSLLSVDPLGDFGEGALWGTWDNDALFLAHSEAGWSPERQLFVYLDTASGGLSSGLPAFSATHTLPFAADRLLVLGAETPSGFAVYAPGSGRWQTASATGWQVAEDYATEIRIDRTIVGARGSVGILAYVMDERGLQQVYPPTARPAERDERATGAALGESLRWADLAANVEPRAGQSRLTTPEIVLGAGREERLREGQTIDFTVAMTRPLSRLEEQPNLVIQSSAGLQLLGVSDAVCVDCPAAGSRWVVAKELRPGQTGQLAVRAKVVNSLPTGSHPVSVTVGLAAGRQDLGPVGVHHWLVDAAVGSVQFLDTTDTIHVQPGPFLVDFDLFGDLLSCLTGVEANTGNGWGAICETGNCAGITGNIAANASMTVQARLTNGPRSSPAAQVTLIADNVAPTAILSPTQVIAASQPFLQGTSSDAFPAGGVPQRVEVSVDGGPFVPVQVAPSMDTSRRSRRGGEAGEWLFPLRLGQMDGQTVQVSVRAVDRAGNVGATTATTVTVDTVGPTVSATQDGSALVIAAQDGSGVATVAVSLDGGKSYTQAQAVGTGWRFALSFGLTDGVALIRATDVWGNQSAVATPVDADVTGTISIYLPTIQRGVSSQRNETKPEATIDTNGVRSVYLPVMGR